MITLKFRPPALSAELQIECTDTVALWEEIVQLAQIFGEKQCGLCNSPVAMATRATKDGNRFYEWKCQDDKCGAAMQLHEYNTKKSGKTGLYRKWDDEYEIWSGKSDDDKLPI